MPQRVPSSSFAALRRFARTEPPSTVEQDAPEPCELCSEPLPPQHRHLLEMESGQIACACTACGLLFENTVDAPFKLIPRDTYSLPDLEIDDARWNALALPIDLTFFVRSGADGGVVARYPSPAGVTESLLPLPAWEIIAEDHPRLAEMEPDVQALLVDRTGNAHRYYLAPLDVCYEVAGLLRLHWRGFSGGDKVWHEIANFFDELDQTARSIPSVDRGS